MYYITTVLLYYTTLGDGLLHSRDEGIVCPLLRPHTHRADAAPDHPHLRSDARAAAAEHAAVGPPRVFDRVVTAPAAAAAARAAHAVAASDEAGASGLELGATFRGAESSMGMLHMRHACMPIMYAC